MEYLNESGWTLRQDEPIEYQTDSLSKLPDPIISVRKTYSEGIDVIRSIHFIDNGFQIISTIESRSSGPAEALEETLTTLDLAKSALRRLCSEDDGFYV